MLTNFKVQPNVRPMVCIVHLFQILGYYNAAINVFWFVLCLSLKVYLSIIYRYIDDLIVFNSKKFLDYLKEIYPSQLTVEKANKSDHLADYLDLTFIIDSGGKLSTRLYDKRDDFDFHIVNFPYLSSNISSGPSYGVYISQLIRYA